MLLSRGRAAFVGVFVLAWALPSCFGADGSDTSDDDDDDTTGGTEASGATGGTGGSSETGGTGPGNGGTAGSGGSGGGSAGEGGSAGVPGGAGGAGGAGGNVTPPPGGSGGTGGSTSGTGGGAGSSGMAGGGGGGAPGAIGTACSAAADCDSGFCLTTDSTELDGAGPAGGLCTVVCADQAVCDADAPGTICVPFTDTTAFCLEACEPGAASEPKCQTRADVGCVAVGTFEGTTECATIEDCAVGEVCVALAEGEPTLCSPVASACAPSCGGDFDCESGQYCDLATGLCVPGSPEGLAIGAACDPAADPDPCAGFCIAVSETDGMCSGSCTFNSTLSGCGFDGSTTPADAICLFLPAYVDPMDVGTGDTGLCGPLCDCNDDCGITGWGCFDIETAIAAGAAAFFGRPGVCRALAAGEALSDGIACEQ